MDISKILGFGAGMNSDIVGYIGSDSMPTCKTAVCWYLYLKPFNITAAQLKAFQVEGVDNNYRGTDFTKDAKYYNKILYTKALLS